MLPHSLALIVDKKVEVKADHVVIQQNQMQAQMIPSKQTDHVCPHHKLKSNLMVSSFI